VVWPWPATESHVAAPSPVPLWGGEENWEKKAKLMGRDKDSLTENRKRTVTTMILLRRIYKNKGIHRAALSHLPMPSCD